MKRMMLFMILILLGTSSSLSLVQAQNTEWNLKDLVDLGALDINDYWEGVFAELKLDYQAPELVLTDREQIRTGCGRTSSDVGPFYCPSDHTIYLPEYFMQYQLDRVGDFAVVVIMAHEWGHAIQAQWADTHSQFSILLELQADCFAGAYTRHADESSRYVVLEDGDLHEGVIALYFAGDRNTDWYDKQAHGDSQQRLTMFLRGFQEGYSAC